MDNIILIPGSACTAPLVRLPEVRTSWGGKLDTRLSLRDIEDINDFCTDSALMLGQRDAESGHQRPNPFDPYFLGGMPCKVFDVFYRRGQNQGMGRQEVVPLFN